ncbi:unnamed protein product [Strongylus vulgaris]|uniref:Uncharacterized protein n=1 Tax=Strongylus vulgaris TaxID=40348 RepID=A0A3P7JL78_STRVU|nr:unnamed protein product [Strongylus vulgaris]
MEASPIPSTPMGKFEEPKYGRVLLSSTFPTASLQKIMSSALHNLEGYRVLGRPRICQAGGKPPPDPSLVADIEAELNKEIVEMRQPTPTVLKKKRKRKASKKLEEERASEDSQSSKPMKAIKVEAVDEMETGANRKDAPRATVSDAKPSHSSLSSTTVEVVDARTDNSNGSLKIRIKLHAQRNSAEATIESWKPPKPVNVRPWAQLNVMEQSYVAKLASLLKVSEVDISRKDWFEEICGKVCSPWDF